MEKGKNFKSYVKKLNLHLDVLGLVIHEYMQHIYEDLWYLDHEIHQLSWSPAKSPSYTSSKYGSNHAL